MRKALVIGIDEYPGNPLSGCVNDAYAMKSVLETDATGSPNFDVKTVTDPSSATKSNVRRLIEDLFGTESDVALLYFAGHGTDLRGGYLVTADATNYDEGISMDEIMTIANRSRASCKIIILDCCYSGSMGCSPNAENITNICDEMIILAASRNYESATEGEDGHGVFTSLLVDALQGGAADIRGYITAGSAYAYIDSALGPWEQRPIFKANVSKFLPIRTVPPKIALDSLRRIVDYFPKPQDKFNLDPTYEDTTEQADESNVKIFKELQRYESEGLVKPVDSEHMYWAAMESKSCELTALGFHYWRLANKKRI
ncbi:caspase family protein [Methanohalophilus euhalobius]|jgi:hypothetical protein|uniref:Caspase domain-containing protein n=1 Tax=Methanohalophilus euhalobius TaxID=51203 RepID=A0A314ZZU5_9EURY|nr:caspase family protein [Methanohalophilus euhalobius]PQV42724.1 caspase domain-containing protein [Methanohalophilus euhalobius]RNI08742.1 caspase family protein [Methanohalophilus euhalobius]